MIKAVEGELQGSKDSDLITLVLKDGNYYEDIQENKPNSKKKLPFVKTHFKQYVLNIDLSELGNVDMDAQQYSKGHNMLNVAELKEEIDTISSTYNLKRKSLHTEVDVIIGAEGLNKNIKIDTLQASNDTLNLEKYFTARQKVEISNNAISSVDVVLRKITSSKKSLTFKKRALNKYEMSLHDKYALGIACVLLFFVGAPLGAIIRKGGLGLPIVVGVVLFLVYHFIGIFAKNGAEEDGIPPFLGSWLATFVVFPLSIFLTYRATRDRGFFNFDFITVPIRNFFVKRFSKKKK